ncbi:MAG: hypothetical protein ACK5AZ_07725 [Bryobacteraceae bacterium]
MRIIIFLGLFSMAASLPAQQVVAPTPEPVGQPRGENVGGYNILNSFEVGQRFRSVDGDLGNYRSDVNFNPGFRLLGSRFSVQSREGQGGYFDEILLDTQGLGNDPYQFASLRAAKNRVYRYEMLWRAQEYYNPALSLARGQHFMDTSRRFQDHSLTLAPQSRLRFQFGYFRNQQDGPALSTVNLFDGRGDEFPLFADVRRRQHEFRAGAELSVAGYRLQFIRAWEQFREDVPLTLGALPQGNNPENPTTLSSFDRTEPYRGSTPSWRVSLFREERDWLAVNGRFTHSMGRRNFVLDETAIGTDRFGAARNRQILVGGDARRPVTTGNLTFSIFPAERLTVTNHSAIHHTRMDGDASYRDFNNGVPLRNFLSFEFLGIRTLANLTDVHVRATRWLGVYTGYHYSARRTRSRQQIEIRGAREGELFSQNNALHSGIVGVRLQPVLALTVNLESEVGRANRPFYPVEERDYHALGARARYKKGSLLLSAAARAHYNFNPTSLSAFSSRSRNYDANASWAPREWFAFDAGYAKLHLDTMGGIAYFLDQSLVTGDRSVYISNLHTANAGVSVRLGRLASLYGGYSRVQDVGDGRRTASGSGVPQFLGAAQTFPVLFDSPLGRLSLRLHPRVRWNFGYQYYRYGEEFTRSSGYRAHTGFTSVLWSF